MIIDCIADLHGHYPKLEGGDLLIVAGDLTARDIENEVALFDYWINEQNYRNKIVVGGNHDNVLAEGRIKLQFAQYLCDSGTEFEGLKIWGSPWTKTFEGMNPNCKAFTVDTEEELASKFSLIPDNIDILVTHSPPYGVLDQNIEEDYCGSSSLIKPMIYSGCKFHIFGHIHESYGKFYNAILDITYINASHVNERYKPVNKPVRIIL
jgi:Icc-related predicted phosphoesterase